MSVGAQITAIYLPLAVAILAFVGGVYGKRQLGRKTDAERIGVEIGNIRGLLNDFKAAYEEQKRINAEMKVEHASDRARIAAEREALTKTVDDLSRAVRVNEGRLLVIGATMAAHGAWDETALDTLRRTVSQEYPAWPNIRIPQDGESV